MGEYLRFNRHDVFNADDRALVLDIIKKVEPFGLEANQLYGLFDGYWYVDLLDNILLTTAIDETLYSDITTLLDKVNAYITKWNAAIA